MRKLVYCWIFLVSGCSHLSTHVWLQDSQQLIDHKQYREAIERLHEEKPKNKSLIAKTQRQATRYRQLQLPKVKRLIRQKKWGDAQDLLDNLVETLPWHSSFSLVQKSLDKEKDEELRLLETKQTLAHANLIKAQILMDDYNHRDRPIYSSIFSRTSSLQEEKKETAKKLFELSIAALAVQDYHNAQKTYGQALSLDKNVKTSLLSDAINMGVYQRNQETILSRQKRLVDQLKQAIKSEDFPSIIRLQGILSKPPFEGRSVAKILDQAEKKRMTTARSLDIKADNIYREGNIKTAIELWKEARNLAPDLLGIQDKLARAIKVQKKLAKLRQNQS